MRKFLGKIAFLFVLFIASGAVLMAVNIPISRSQREHDYSACVLDKVNRLKSIHVPKIILVGNSNLAFGIDSHMIQEEFGMPVVNLGYHGGMGNAFHENMARLNISSGDIVIVCHSNYSDDSRVPDPSLAWHTLAYHPDLWELLDREDLFTALLAGPSCVLRSTYHGLTDRKNKPHTSYERESFNECGDVYFKPEEERKSPEVMFTEGKASVPAVNKTCIDRLNKFNRFITQRGAHMLVAGYPIARVKTAPPAEEFVKFQQKLGESLDCEVISDYRDYFIPCEYLYDYVLHLSPKGTEVRTKQLILDIKNWRKKHSRLLPAMPMLRIGQRPS